MEKEIYEILDKYYGYQEFRYNQKEIVLSIMSHVDTVAILRTGGGKSICFQIPAILASGLTLVITPLISLMQDQVKNLKEKHIKSAFINSTVEEQEIDLIYQKLDKIKLLYISPERLTNEKFLQAIKSVEISYIIVDEAHFVSTWGHEFRKSYLDIAEFRNKICPNVTMACFSATVSADILKDIIILLGLKNPNIINLFQDRKNLYYGIYNFKDKKKYLIKFLFSNKGKKTIIYALTRSRVEEIYTFLLNLNFKVTFYHGGLDSSQKKNNQEQFTNDEKDIIVATNSFGAGVSIDTVINVICYEIPISLEELAQEWGRACRLDQNGNCLLLYDDKDIKGAEYLIEQSTDLDNKKEMYKRLKKVLDYANSKECLHYLLAKNFYDVKPYKCKNCSNCKSKKNKV